MTRKKPASQKQSTGARKRAAERPTEESPVAAVEAEVLVAPPPDPPEAIEATAAPVIVIECRTLFSGRFRLLMATMDSSRLKASRVVLA